MRWNRTLAFVLTGISLTAGYAAAQNDQAAVPKSSVTRKSIKAIGYQVGGGATKVIFMGTSAASAAGGEAKVEAKKAATDIDLKVNGLPQPLRSERNSSRMSSGPFRPTAAPPTWVKCWSTKTAKAS